MNEKTMHIFVREMKSHVKSLSIWSISMVALLVVSMVKFGSLSAGGQAVEQLMGQFPATIQAVFGMAGLDPTTVSGYYGVLFLYVAVIAAIHAGLLGEELFTKEERDKTTEFLYVRPLSRSHAVTEKLAAGLCNVAILNIMTLIGSFVAVAGYTDISVVQGELLRFMLALALIQLVFFFLGTLSASVSKKAKTPGRVVSLLVFASYFLYVLFKLAPSVTALRLFSVFSYFDAGTILSAGSLDMCYVFLCVAIAAIGCIGTYVFYRKRDFSI